MPEWIVKEDPDIALGMLGRAKIGVLGGTIQDELIRCTDCVYYYNGACMNTEGMITPEPYGFCSNAERKENGSGL